MKIISLIPARSGSKGIANKNLALLGGHPLLAWSIKASLLTTSIDRTIVSTDSTEYAEVAKAYGAEVPFLRPKNLATDSSKDIDFVLHALGELARDNYFPDMIIHLRPTSPFRDPSLMDNIINQHVNDFKYTSLRSVHEMSESAYKTFEIDNEGYLMSIFHRDKNIENSNIARQVFPKTFVANGYLDILNVSYIKSQGQIHGNNVKSFITEPVIEVDTQTELDFLRNQSRDNLSLSKLLFGE